MGRPSFASAVGGSALTALGYSLVYPGFGVEAVRRAPAQSSALAMGAYTACLDLAQQFAHAPAADCKGKAVALYQRMRANGARNLRLVIGKRTPVSRSTHTWVEWTSASVTFILDPTINWAAQAVNEIPENSYVPYYAYTGSQRYRAAAATSLYAGL